MNLSVDIETAKELRDAGFPQYVPTEGALYIARDNDNVQTPTALEIIEQMPYETSLKHSSTGDWECAFNLPSYQRDYRADPCQHKAAALAYIAWKKGME